MSEHLEKAKAALADARELDGAAHDRPRMAQLLDIAAVQSQVSIAESLEQIALHICNPTYPRPRFMFGEIE